MKPDKLLANGNPQRIDEDAYLIFGISDNKQTIHNITDEMLFNTRKYTNIPKLEQYVLTQLKNLATPDFLGLKLEFLEYKEKRVLLIIIPPHPYLLSLSKDLNLKNRTDKNGTVYFRIGEEINIASPDVIKAFAEQRKKQDSITTIINNDNTKVAIQNSTNNGTQTFNF